MTEESKRIISQYINEFNSPPRYAPCDVSTDAILMGNGDMAVAISGAADNLRFWLNKNDFWRLQNKHDGCKPVVMGGIDLAMPALNEASYNIEQQLYFESYHTGTRLAERWKIPAVAG